MNIIIRPYQDADLPSMNQIWNEVVEDGVAFPQEDFLNTETGKAFFAEHNALYAGRRSATRPASSR